MIRNLYYLWRECKKHRIKCKLYLTDKGTANVPKRVIHITVPWNRSRLAVAYHEIGHIVHKRGAECYMDMGEVFSEFMATPVGFTTKLGLITECNACLFAINNFPYPITKPVIKIIKQSINSYAGIYEGKYPLEFHKLRKRII